MRKRILISANTTWNIANFRYGLIKRLIAEGYEVHVAAPSDSSVEQLEALGCIHHLLKINNKGTSPAEDFNLVTQYYSIMKCVNPIIYLGYTIKPNIYGNFAACLTQTPTVNNISGLGTAFIRKTWVTFIVKQLYRWALSKSSKVFFQNNDDLALFVDEGLVARAVVDVLPGSGVDLNYFSQHPYAPQRPLTFLLVARILWDKGVGEYVEAARILKMQNVLARFQLLGFLDVVNETAIPKDTVYSWDNEGVIEFLGARDDVRPFLKEADCIVLPSYREGTPRTLLEAAATGRPIITTDVPGCREVVEDGLNGYLCRVRDGADLAEKMKAFISLGPDAQKKMGQESRNLAERVFDEKFVVSRYVNTISKITE